MRWCVARVVAAGVFDIVSLKENWKGARPRPDGVSAWTP
jgi:hypothetical protein